MHQSKLSSEAPWRQSNSLRVIWPHPDWVVAPLTGTNSATGGVAKQWVAPTIYLATTLADHGGVASIAKTRPCHTGLELARPKHAPTERAFIESARRRAALPRACRAATFAVLTLIIWLVDALVASLIGIAVIQARPLP